MNTKAEATRKLQYERIIGRINMTAKSLQHSVTFYENELAKWAVQHLKDDGFEVILNKSKMRFFGEAIAYYEVSW